MPYKGLEIGPKRALFVLSGTFSDGGMLEYARAWADWLTREGWKTGLAGHPDIVERFMDGCEGFPIFDKGGDPGRLYAKTTIDSLFRIGTARSMLKRLADAVAGFDPGIVHILDRSLYTGCIMDHVSYRFPRVPVVSTIHDPKRHDEKITLAGRILKVVDDRNIRKSLARKNTFIHVHGIRLVEGSIYEGSKKILEIAHPVPPTRARRTRREVAGGESFPIRLGFLGRIERYKGLDVFHQALSMLFSSGALRPESVEVVLAGKGAIEQPWQALPCRVDIRNEMISDEEFHEIMADLDLLVLPYRDGTQSGVGMMGLAYSIPLVLTNVGALEKLVVDGETGILVPPGDAVSLGQAIRSLVESPGKIATMRRRLSEIYRNGGAGCSTS